MTPIPPKLKPGPKGKYAWSTMKRGDFRDGESRESLIRAFTNYFSSRNASARFTTRRINETTFRIYRTR